MENSRLPIEVCELIIDSILDHWPWWADFDWLSLMRASRYWHIAAWRTVRYTTVCSAWLPRARRILYHTILLVKSSQVDLLVRSIKANPSLAGMVHELAVVPNGTYIPFVQARLVASLANLRLLAYIPCNHLYPPHYHSLVPRSITQLAIHFGERVWPGTGMWFETVRLIWSLPELQRLCLQMIEYPKITQSDLWRLKAIQRPWACAKLKTLVLQGEYCCNMLPECAFGISVQRLSLEFRGNDLRDNKFELFSEHGPLWAQIKLFSSLQQLHVCVLQSGTPGQDTSAISRYIVPVLMHLGDAPIQTVSFRLQQLNLKGRRGHFMLEIRSKVDELLTKFPELEAVCFQLPPLVSPPHDANMWERLLPDHLPKLKSERAVQVKLKWH